MRSVFLLASIYLVSAAKLERRSNSLRREPIVYKDGLPIAQVQVGTPAQNFSVVFDTSNSLTWVPSTECHTKVCRQHSQIYNADSSVTAVNLHKKASIKYDEGVCVDARLYTDTVTVAGIAVPNQLFGSAYSVKGLGGDGYLGSFGLGGYNEDGTTSYYTPKSSASLSKRQTVPGAGFVQNAYQLGSGQTSLQFSMTATSSNGFYQKRSNVADAEFIFGVDHDVYKGDIAYLKLPTCDYGDSPYWKSELNCVKLGDFDLKLAKKSLASFSTGSSFILAPTKQADLLHASIEGHYDEDEDYYRLECCDKIDKLPTLKFDFNGYRVSIPPHLYVEKDSDDECHTLIGRNYDSHKNWVLGGAFLNNFYHIYDLENKQIGLALPKGETTVQIHKTH